MADIRFDGKVAIVTGAGGGLGKQHALELARRGAKVVVNDLGGSMDGSGGSSAAADAVVEEIKAMGGEAISNGSSVTDDAGVAHMVKQTMDQWGRIDVLIANAGIMACPQGSTTDGFELQFGTNHLGHFLLINRLLPLLLNAKAARVVLLSSSGHRFGDVSLDDPNFERTPYDAWMAYGRAKTANVLFAVELDRRYRSQGLRATAVHPGGIVTDLGRHLTDETINALIEARSGAEIKWKNVQQGAATSVWAGFVADADAVGGRYCEDCAVAPVIDDVAHTPGVMGYALDPDTAAGLWTLSEHLVGETFSAGEIQPR